MTWRSWIPWQTPAAVEAVVPPVPSPAPLPEDALALIQRTLVETMLLRLTVLSEAWEAERVRQAAIHDHDRLVRDAVLQVQRELADEVRRLDRHVRQAGHGSDP